MPVMPLHRRYSSLKYSKLNSFFVIGTPHVLCVRSFYFRKIQFDFSVILIHNLIKDYTIFKYIEMTQNYFWNHYHKAHEVFTKNTKLLNKGIRLVRRRRKDTKLSRKLFVLNSVYYFKSVTLMMVSSPGPKVVPITVIVSPIATLRYFLGSAIFGMLMVPV